MLALQEGQTDVASDHLARAVGLDQRQFREVALQLIDVYDLPDIALEIAGDNASRLRVIAGVFQDRGQSTEAVETVRAKMLTQLEKQSLEPMAPAWVFASLAVAYQQNGRLDDAIAHYRRALAKDYGQVNWRYRLARLLGETGKIRQAIEEAETCLRLRQGHTGAQRLIERLSSQAARQEANTGR
jgi:tetratricopeptide (TPR) repeat protein